MPFLLQDGEDVKPHLLSAAVFHFCHFMAFSQHLILQIQFSMHKLLKHAYGSTCVFHYWLASTALVITQKS